MLMTHDDDDLLWEAAVSFSQTKVWWVLEIGMSRAVVFKLN